jgi:hypothetical protein
MPHAVVPIRHSYRLVNLNNLNSRRVPLKVSDSVSVAVISLDNVGVNKYMPFLSAKYAITKVLASYFAMVCDDDDVITPPIDVQQIRGNRMEVNSVV